MPPPPSPPRADVLERLFALESFGIKLGLENIARLCEALGHPERSFTTLHVAGTNGKGSVAAMTHAGLVAAGIRSGRYTSPHLSDITERFVVDGAPVTRATLEAAAQRVLDCAARLQADGRLRVPPTFFEATTATAFEIFRDAGVDVAVIEVGMGGRFDATNIIAPLAGAITTIGLDHQQYLGESLAQIAFEKAGIIKPGITIVTGALPPDAQAVVSRIATERGARLLPAASDARIQFSMEDGLAQVTIATPRATYGPVVLGLRGVHQVENALLAIRLLEVVEEAGIRVTADAIERGLAKPDWPARLEVFTLAGGRRVLLDAAHNVDGATALASYIREWHPDPPTLVVGVMHDKDVDAMLRILLPVVSGVVATAAPSPRAMSPDELARRVAVAATASGATGGDGAPLPVLAVRDPEDAIRQALGRGRDVCVAGSIFLAGAVRGDLVRRAILR